MKNSIIITVFLFCTNGLAAQMQYGSEWNFHAGGGSSMFKFNSDLMMNEKEHSKAGIGGNLGADYAHFFSPYWGVSLGVELAVYNHSITSPNILRTEQQIETPPGLTGNFYLRTQYDGIMEKQTATLVQLPLLLRLQLPLGKHFFSLAAGVKYGIPLSASYTQTINTVTTTGYSDYLQQTLENMPKHGFETLHDVRLSDKLTLPNSTVIALETGVKWQTTEKSSLYTGIYLDTGRALGIKLGFALGSGRKLGRSDKPVPLWGD